MYYINCLIKYAFFILRPGLITILFLIYEAMLAFIPLNYVCSDHFFN